MNGGIPADLLQLTALDNAGIYRHNRIDVATPELTLLDTGRSNGVATESVSGSGDNLEVLIVTPKPLRIAKPDGRREPRKIAFTKRMLEGLPAPEQGQRSYYDARTPGLCLLVTPGGAKTFYRYGRIDGRPCRVKIGGFPAVTVEQARKAAARLNGDIASGADPAARRRAMLAETTFGGLFQKYIDLHAKPHKRTVADDERLYERFLERWATRKVTDIDPAAVSVLHAKVGADHGPYIANRLGALVSAVFGFGRRVLRLTQDNPARGVQRFPEQSRERFLSAEELRRLFDALATETNADLRDLVEMALFTGARRGNLLAMRWAALDLDAWTWTIPSGEYKSKRETTIILAPPAVAILKRRRRAQAATPGEYVFPSWGGTGHITEPKKAWGKLRTRAGLPDVRLHDLRRTFGSWQAAAGASSTIIGRSLGHKAGSPATAVYARMDLTPVRAAVDTAVAAMQGAATKPAKKGGRGHAKTR